MMDLLQVAGALLILAAFVAAQYGVLSPRARLYLVLNLAGSALLTWIAFDDRDWGFLLLESVWAVVSAWGLAQVLLRGRAPGVPH
jgi:hypothetical protein